MAGRSRVRRGDCIGLFEILCSGSTRCWARRNQRTILSRLHQQRPGYRKSLAWQWRWCAIHASAPRFESSSNRSSGIVNIDIGMQSISHALASSLKLGSVLLNTPVQGIKQLGFNQCLVTTAGGATFRCRRVIVSVPTPLYCRIIFSPPLPTDKKVYSESTFLGDYSKFSLVYAEPWWRKLGLSGSFIDLNGPVSFSRDTSADDDKQFSLTFFIVGDDCRKWAKLTTTERRDAILENISDMIATSEGRRLLYDYTDARETLWKSEQWSEGAPCPVPGPGVWERLGPSLRIPFENIHFVGTETAFLWKGYLEGAVTSGERGAREVIQELRSNVKI